MTLPRQRPTVCRNRIGSTETFFRAAHSPCFVTFSDGSGLESEPKTAAVLLRSKCFFVMATVPGLAKAVGVLLLPVVSVKAKLQVDFYSPQTRLGICRCRAGLHGPPGCLIFLSPDRKRTDCVLLHGFAVIIFVFIAIKVSVLSIAAIVSDALECHD